MNTVGRKADNYKLNHLYTNINGDRGDYYYLCVYCGSPASERDHVPPLSRVDDYRSLMLKKEIYIKVPSCVQCNGIGASILDDTFLDRVERIKSKIAEKHKKKISYPEWDEEDLAELDYELKTKVLEGVELKKTITNMVNYYEGVDLVLDHLDVLFGGQQ